MVHLLSQETYSQKYIPGSVIQIGSDHHKQVHSMVYDSIGNAWLYGFFEHELHMQNSIIPAMGHRDLFISFLSTDGTLKWSRTFRSSNNAGFNHAILMDDQSLLVTGWFDDTLNIDGISYFGKYGHQIFILQVGRNGQITEFNILIPDFKGRIVSMDRNSNGEVLLFGNFSRSAYVLNRMIESEGKQDGLILRLGNNRTSVIPVTLSGAGKISVSGGAFYSDGFMVAGEFSDELILGDTTLYANGKRDIFLARFNNQNEIIGSVSLGSERTEVFGDMTVDSDGNVYVAGSYKGIMIQETQEIKSNGNHDIFLIKVDTNDRLRWIKSWGGQSNDYVSSLVCNDIGRLFLAGSYKNTIILLSDTLQTNQRFCNGFISCLDTEYGDPWWTLNLSGTGSVGPLSLASFSDERILAAGIFHEQVFIEEVALSSTGMGDIFLATYLNPCSLLTFDLPDQSYLCQAGPDTLNAGPGFQSYTWNDGLSESQHLVIEEPGKFWVSITDQYGCQASDTILVLLDTISYQVEMLYEMLPDGNNGQINITPLTGIPPFHITWSDFYPGMTRDQLAAGDYTFTLTDIAGCSVIGEVTVGRRNSTEILDIMASPNPVNKISRIWYYLPDNVYMELALFDSSGRKIEVIYSGIYKKGTYEFDWSPGGLKSGLYYLKLTTPHEMASCKIFIK